MATWKQILTADDIGSQVQAYDADIATLAGLTEADNSFIVGSGSGWTVESNTTALATLNGATRGANSDITALSTITGNIIAGAEGSHSLWTDAGANTITIGQSTSTITIAGNLTVSGSTTQVNTEVLNVEDQCIILNHGTTGSPTEDSGIEVERGDSTNQCLYWDESEDQWCIFGGTIADAAAATTPLAKVGTFKIKTDAGAPSGNHEGIGEIIFNSNDTKLYIRTA